MQPGADYSFFSSYPSALAVVLTDLYRQWSLRRRLDKRIPALGPVGRVVVMCTANRVRSPFAALYLARGLDSGVKVVSRGVLEGGAPCPQEAIEAAALHGLDLSSHRSTKVSANELLQADLVLTMELRMAHELAVHYPALERSLVPLGYFDEEHPMQDIADPFMLPRAEYELTYDQIAECCDGLLVRMAPA